MTSPTGDSLRLGGLLSGMPTDDIIQQLLAAEQSKIDKLEEEKEIAKAKIETWKDLAADLKAFGENARKLTGDKGDLYTLKSATSSSASVNATATASASNATHVVAVTQLARSHVAYGSQKAAGYTLPAAGSVIINGASISFSGGETLSQVAAAINGAAYTTGNAVIATIIDNRLTLRTKDTGAAATIHGTAAGTPPFNLGTDDPDAILSTELGLINGGGNLINEAQTSQDATFSVDGISLSRSTNTVTDAITGVTLELLDITGSDAQVAVTNDTQEIKEALVDFIDLYNGLRSQIEAIRTAKLNEDEKFGMFFSDPLMRGIYNELRSLSTSGIRMGDTVWDGSLNASGAASVGATQITIANFTAGTGTLSAGDEFVIDGDTTTYRLVNDASVSGNSATVDIYPPLVLATAGGESINVAVRSMEAFGIQVRNDSGLAIEGILGLTDEAKLDSILASDVELIKRIMGRGTSSSGSASQGTARRLYSYIDYQTKVSELVSIKRSIDDSKIDGLEDKVEDLEEQIRRLKDRMAKKEEMLVLQFARMEQAMAQAQAAGGAIAGLGGGGAQQG